MIKKQKRFEKFGYPGAGDLGVEPPDAGAMGVWGRTFSCKKCLNPDRDPFGLNSPLP